MDWIKVKTQDVLFSGLTPSEKGVLVMIQALTAHLERIPTESEMAALPGVSRNTIERLSEALRSINGSLSEVHRNVIGAVSEVHRKREAASERKRRSRSGYEDVTRDVTVTSQGPFKELDKSKSRLDKIKKIIIKKPTKTWKTKDELLSDFEDLWSKYPKKFGKDHARRQFLKRITNQDKLEKIQRAMKNYLDSLMGDNTEFGYVKHGGTWFNQWEDYLDYDYIPADSKPRS